MFHLDQYTIRNMLQIQRYVNPPFPVTEKLYVNPSAVQACSGYTTIYYSIMRNRRDLNFSPGPYNI